jgi:hypothetical protein
MSQSQVISFRASGHFLNWIEAQKLDGESSSQAAQRLLKEMSGTSTATELSTKTSTKTSTPNNTSVASTKVSTVSSDSVDKIVGDRIDPVLERVVAIEERLGKLSA